MKRELDDEELKRALGSLRNDDPAPEWMRERLREILLQEAQRKEQAARPVRGKALAGRPWWRSRWVVGIASPAVVAAAAAILALRLAGVWGPALSYARILEPVLLATGSPECVHLVLNVRERPDEEMGFIVPTGESVRAEAWVRWPASARSAGADAGQRSVEPGRLRVEKPEWSYVADGKSVVYFWPRQNQALRHPVGSARFEMAWPAAWVEKILEAPEGAEVIETVEGDAAVGTPSRLLLRWDAPALRGRAPAWFEDYPREVEIQWDARSKRLMGFRRWVFVDGKRIAVTELAAIEYLPSIPDETFSISLPEGVRFVELIPAPPEIDALGPREAAEFFWKAAIAGDWETVRYFVPNPKLLDWLRDKRPVELRALGQPEKSGNYVGVFIPYHVKYAERGGRTKHRIAMRNDNQFGRWVVDGGI